MTLLRAELIALIHYTFRVEFYIYQGYGIDLILPFPSLDLEHKVLRKIEKFMYFFAMFIT